MSKKRKIDFILAQSDDERLVFRFYPRQSSCHSFGDEPPKSWSEVYKVYYSYAILKQWKFDIEDQWETEIMFEEDFDECSIIDEVGQRCLLLADGYETFERKDGERIPLLDRTIYPFGMGTNWTISKRILDGYDKDGKNIIDTYYKFTLFNYFNKGFKFSINEKDIKAFGEYLLECCEYMLAHGDSI